MSPRKSRGHRVVTALVAGIAAAVATAAGYADGRLARVAAIIAVGVLVAAAALIGSDWMPISVPG